MSLTITGPVGDLTGTRSSGNATNDVRGVQRILHRSRIAPDLSENGLASGALTAAISRFQGLFSSSPDGRVDPRGSTLSKLNEVGDDKTIIVDLNLQNLYAFNNLNLVYNFNCATGAASDRTPPGFYHLNHRRHRVYRSRTYNAQMNYAQFFHRGYAIHQSNLVAVTSYARYMGLESIGSHGCVRLSEDDARTLFNWGRTGIPVVVLPAD